MVTWLDGLSPGEDDMGAMMDCLGAKGACALNIIPDRNHRIDDADLRARKLRKLEEVVQAAEARAMPINIGTEMNKHGQPFADDMGCEALRPYLEPFLRGARIMVGHTLLLRFADFSYTGAAAEFGKDARKKNDLFESVGRLPALTTEGADRLQEMGPEKALSCLRDSAGKGEWVL